MPTPDSSRSRSVRQSHRRGYNKEILGQKRVEFTAARARNMPCPPRWREGSIPRRRCAGQGSYAPRTYMDLGFLRPLYQNSAPVASVHINTSRTTTDDAKEIELRRRHLCQELALLGTDTATLDVLQEAIREETPRTYGEHGQSLFASQGQLLGAHTLDVPPERDQALWMPIPDPLPLVVDQGRHLPYVLVALDRVNAKVTGYTAPGATQRPAVAEDSTGQTMHNIDGPGGRSGPGQRRGLGARSDIGHSAQEIWRENTAQVAQRVHEAAQAVNAQAILVGGDEEAITYLRENLGPRKLTIPIRIIAGGRGGTAAQERLHQAAQQELHDLVAQQHDQVLSDYRQKLGRDQAVDGIDAIASMLSEARVQTLLLGAQRQGEQHLWGSIDEPVLVAKNQADLDGSGKTFRAPAGALMLRSAVAADSQFTELLEQGRTSADNGAILRFANNTG